MREDPQSLIPFLEYRISSFTKDDPLTYIENGRRIKTKEGVQAIQKAIKFLKTAKKVEPVEMSQYVSAPSRLYAALSGLNGNENPDAQSIAGVNNVQSFESLISEFRYGRKWYKYGNSRSNYDNYAFQMVTYGAKSARQVVVDMII